MAQTGRILKRKLSDDVLERLMAMIRSDQFAPGDEFPSERELMEQFGVGRPAIREAMQSLQSAGFIIVSQGQRPKFTLPTAQGMFSQVDIAAVHILENSPNSLEYLKDARKLFEVGIVRRAAENATKEDIEHMQAALYAQTQAAQVDANRFVEADIAFHIAIAKATKNPIFVATSEAMLGWLKKYQVNIVRFAGKESITLEEHQNVIEAISNKDPDAAAFAMTDHLNRSREMVQKGDNSK